MGNSANTDSIRQAKGEPGQAPIPTPTLETDRRNIFQKYLEIKKLPKPKFKYSKKVTKIRKESTNFFDATK